jgi:hypothetical protein
MKNSYFESLLGEMASRKIPLGMKLLRKIASIDWSEVEEEEIDFGCEILLRLNADVIFESSRQQDGRFRNSRVLYLKIVNNINQSNILYRSSEFFRYFAKLQMYMNEIE